MNPVRPRSLGLAFGLFLALFHAVWAIMVATGVAQWFMDMVLNLHMIEPFYVIAPFDLMFALGLIVFTFVFGYLMGWVLGYIWNRYAVK
jgi:hypothetical protein